MTAIRAVFFDVVGTLLHPEPSAVVVYTDVGKRFGSRLDSESVRQSFRAAFARQEEVDRASGWRTNEAREVDRWRTIVEEVLHDVRDTEACFAELYEHFAAPAHWRCDPDAADVIAELRGNGLQVGLASNYDPRLHRVLKGFPSLAESEHIVISSELGWRKPASQFFSQLSEVSGIAPADILHVGDDQANDYQGALAAGCKALLYDPLGIAPQAYSIRRLRKVIEVCGSR